MGQQQSKDGSKTPKDSSSTSLDRLGDGLQSYPSFSKSDTKESSRSFRSIRSKIPGSSKDKSDSPRPSLSAIDTSVGNDRSDAASTRSATSAKSNGSKANIPQISPVPPSPAGSNDMKDGSPRPPPSPTMSASVGHGHEAVSKAQAQGEVDHVSDAPPVGTLHPSHNEEPGESILMKPARPAKHKMPLTPKFKPVSDDGMEIGALKSIDLDDMITRLLDAGYSTKITKT
ncbi:MAG: hypothetical protein Q9198_010540, partial [Flavoplaca austrocitrina]